MLKKLINLLLQGNLNPSLPICIQMSHSIVEILFIFSHVRKKIKNVYFNDLNHSPQYII